MSATQRPSSSSVVSLLVLKFARFLFICPVFEALWSPVSEIQEGPYVQPEHDRPGLFTNNTSFPGLPWRCVFSRLPKPQGARGGGARAGPGMDLGYYQGPRPPRPLGAFSGKGAWAGGGLIALTHGTCDLRTGAGGNEHVHTPENGGLGIG
jgi:hypothetical protein